MTSITSYHYISFNLNHNIFLFLLNNFVIFIQNIYFSSLAKSFFFFNFVIKSSDSSYFFLNKFVFFIYFSSHEYQAMKNKCLQGLPPTPTYLITHDFIKIAWSLGITNCLSLPSPERFGNQHTDKHIPTWSFFKNFALF